MTYKEEFLKIPNILRQVLKEESEPCLEKAKRVVFCGCGTSFYMGHQLAHIIKYHGKQAISVSAINLIEEYSDYRSGDVYVFISRSGNSMETLQAMKVAKSAGAETFYLGCACGSKLDLNCNGSRVILYGKESLVLESYSFYAQFLLAWRCLGLPVENRIPQIAEYAILLADDCFEKFCIPEKIKRVICLGASFYMPLLREMMLKNGEITQLPVENWEILEFRHGPRSWADEHTLIYILPWIKNTAWEMRVAEELVSYGCPVIYLFEKKLQGAYSVDFGTNRGSIEESLAAGVFITALALRIGQALQTVPEQMKHVCYNVEEL